MVGRMNDIMIQSAISNPEWAARMLVEQFSKIPASAGVPPASLFLNDTYALGHAYGFSEQAARHVSGEREDDYGPAYVEEVFASLLKDKAKAKSVLRLVSLQSDDLRFQKGYDLGVVDLNDWVLSRGQNLPSGLLHLYGSEAGGGRIATYF